MIDVIHSTVERQNLNAVKSTQQNTQGELWESKQSESQSQLIYILHIIGKMALNNVLLISQITGHIMAMVLSMCVVIPMFMHNSKFK